LADTYKPILQKEVKRKINKMRNTLLLTFILGCFLSYSIISQEHFTVQIEPLTVMGAPNIHSFSWGKTSDGKWLIFGGRIEGLHQQSHSWC
jgi:hypothetical protein